MEGGKEGGRGGVQQSKAFPEMFVVDPLLHFGGCQLIQRVFAESLLRMVLHEANMLLAAKARPLDAKAGLYYLWNLEWMPPTKHRFLLNFFFRAG